MTENDGSTDNPATAKTVEPPQRGRGRSGLALITAAIALVIAGYLGYLLLVARPDLLTTDVTGEIARLQDDNRLLRESLTSLEEDMTLLRETGETTRTELDSVQGDLAQNRIDWTLTETERLLVIANHRLQLARDTASALFALRAAERQLEHIPNPDLLTIRRQLAREITALESFEKTDVTGLALRLASLAEGVDKLPHAPQTRAPSPTGDDATAPSPWNHLLPLVRIRQDAEPRMPLLPPEQVYFVRENLKLMLYGAEQAILQGNSAIYRQNLETARRWLQAYFDSRAPKVTAMTGELDQLLAAKIAGALPDISGSLESLRRLPRRSPES